MINQHVTRIGYYRVNFNCRDILRERTLLAGRPMAGHGPLEPGMEVRVLPGQPILKSMTRPERL